MNTYHAFFRGQEIELTAASSYAAQRKAAEEFKVSVKKAYLIAVILVAVDGKSITHSTSEI